jgi:hypothetical protein
MTDRRWRVGECASSQILHEHLHRPALVAKEVVDLGEHEAGDVAGACLIDGLAKQLVVRGTLDEIVDECPGVANQRSCATDWHRTTRVRRCVLLALERASCSPSETHGGIAV